MLRRALSRGTGRCRYMLWLCRTRAFFTWIGIYHHAGHGGNERNALARMILGKRQLVGGYRRTNTNASTLRAILFIILGLGAFIIMSSTKFFRQLVELLQRAAKARASWLYVEASRTK